MTGKAINVFLPLTQDRSLLSSHPVKVSGKAEAESEHDDFEFRKKKRKKNPWKILPCSILFFYGLVTGH